MDRALENALARRDAILSEIKSLQERIAPLRQEADDIDRFIEAWHRYAGSSEPLEAGHRTLAATLPAPLREDRPARATGNPKKEEVAEAARRIIQAHGEPMPRSDLYGALTASGIEIRGVDPEKTLSTMLWRMRDRVARVKGGGYWLQEVPYPEAGYVPEGSDPPASETQTAKEVPHKPDLVSEHARLSEEVKAADRAYYDDDAPTLSDAQYDEKRRRMEEIESNLGGLME